MAIGEQTLWKLCAASGVATLIASLLIFPLFPADAAMDVSGYGGPVYAFEFAGSKADLTAIFGTEEDPDRARRLAMMDRGNLWDFGFMTLYGLFGLCFGWAILKNGVRFGRLIMGFALLGSVSDLIETGTLLALSEEFAADGSALPGLTYLRMVVTLKFAAIGSVIGLAGLYLWGRAASHWRWAGAACCVSALILLLGLVQPASYGAILGLGIGIGWIIMLAYAIRYAVKGATPPRR